MPTNVLVKVPLMPQTVKNLPSNIRSCILLYCYSFCVLTIKLLLNDVCYFVGTIQTFKIEN